MCASYGLSRKRYRHNSDSFNSVNPRLLLDRALPLSDRELGLRFKWERTVFVSNIPYDMKWPQLKDLFKKKVGDVVYCEIFEKNGTSSGTAAIEFKTAEVAKKAVELMHQQEAEGRKLNVKLDEDGFRTRKAKEQSLASNLPLNPRLDPDFDMLPPALSFDAPLPLGYALNNSLASFSDVSPQILQRLGLEGPISNRVYVSNLDFKVDDRKLFEVFSLAGMIVDYVLFKDKNGRSKGQAVVEYDHPLEAVQAISMLNGQALYDRALVVKMDKKSEDLYPAAAYSASKLPAGLRGLGSGLGDDGLPVRNLSKYLMMEEERFAADRLMDRKPQIGLRGMGSGLNSLMGDPDLGRSSSKLPRLDSRRQGTQKRPF